MGQGSEGLTTAPNYKWWVVFMLWFVCFFAWCGAIYLLAAALLAVGIWTLPKKP